MATNPMQRKSRVSFLLGMLVTLIFAAAIIAFLFMQLKTYKDKEAADKAATVTVYVLNQEVFSGQTITSDMITTEQVNKNTVPSNAIGEISTTLNGYSLSVSNEDNDIVYTDSNKRLCVDIDGSTKTLQKGENGKYYYTENGQNIEITLTEAPLEAKVYMTANTVLTPELIYGSDTKVTDDLRVQEYNMIVLPTQIQTGDVIDVRLTMPNGQDYIVVSKKRVEIPQISGVDSEDTIWIELTEDEILTMSNAIVEAYKLKGAKLYATKYVEAGMQNISTPTYSVSREVLSLVNSDPNIVETAKNALWQRYNADQRNNAINPALEENQDQNKTNLESNLEKEITNTKDNRKKYLESLSAPAQ